MTFRGTRDPRSCFALALGGMGLVACGSPSPTSPSPAAVADTAPAVMAASAPAASGTTGDAQAAAATTIAIKQGTLTLRTFFTGSVALRGSHGFRFDGSILSGLEPSAYCSPFDPCQPGTTVPFTATWVGTDMPGTLRLLGQEYQVGSLDTGSMYIELTGSFVAPAHLTDAASVKIPFTATGLVSRGYPYPQVPLTGGGEVTFTLEWQPFIGGWAIRFSSFDFGRGAAG